jgi:hypothetical protein
MGKKYNRKEFLCKEEEELNSSNNSDDNGNEDLVKEKSRFTTPDMTPRKPETVVSDFNLQDSSTSINDVFSFNDPNDFFNSLQQKNESGVRNSYDSLNAEWSENKPSSSSLVDGKFFPERIEVTDYDPDQSFLSNSEEEEKGDKADNLLLSVILCALVAVLSFVIYLIFFSSSDKKEEENL